jgi:ssRNA-specific RNase YbeY (16S rRNA maturation enzyme)
MASTDLVFADEASATAALKDVRSNDTPTNWVLFTYSESGKNTLELVGKGSGGVEELKSHLDEAKMFYGLVRVTEKIDNSITVKFVFVIWCGTKVPFVQKAKMTTHKGSITQLIGQFHTDLNCSDPDEISEEIIMNKVTAASGTAVHVKDVHKSESQTSSSIPQRTTAPKTTSSATAKPASAPGSASVVSWVDEDNIRAAIKAVRANNDETDWLLLTYEGNSTKIRLEATGSHGLEELTSHLKPDQVQYGLFRTTDTVDNTIAVKFVLILWVGEEVPFTRKARITTHKGEVTAFIGQYHVDCSCSNLNEINEDIIRDLVQRASGTAVYVK